MISDKCTTACMRGHCDCGAIVNDVLQVGKTVHIPLMMKDGAPSPSQPERTGIDMTTDSQAIADRQMQTQGFIDQSIVDAEAAKPEYEVFRGRIHNDGTPLAKYFARMALIRNGALGARSDAARDHMISKMGSQHRPVNDNRSAPQFARDGRAMTSLTDSERAREEMIARMSDGHKR